MLKYENIFLALLSVFTVGTFLSLLFFGEFQSLHTILFREISYLISPYSPEKKITIPIFILYNLYLLIFSCLLYLRLHNYYAKLGAEFLSISAVSGFVLVLFPMAPPGGMQTTSGMVHIIIALYMALTIVVAIWLLGSAFKKSKNLLWLSKDSISIGIIIAFLGCLTGIFAVFQLSLFVGFFEKIPIGAFLLWILLTGIGMVKSDRRIKYIFIKVKHNR